MASELWVSAGTEEAGEQYPSAGNAAAPGGGSASGGVGGRPFRKRSGKGYTSVGFLPALQTLVSAVWSVPPPPPAPPLFFLVVDIPGNHDLSTLRGLRQQKNGKNMSIFIWGF